MSGFSPLHTLIFLLVVSSLTIPFFFIFPRAGIPSWVAIFCVFPPIALVFLWVLALKTWPMDRA